MAFSGASIHCPRCKGKKRAEDPLQKSAYEAQGGALSLAPPNPPSLQCRQAASHQQRKKSHLAVLILAALCLTGRISWLDL